MKFPYQPFVFFTALLLSQVANAQLFGEQQIISVEVDGARKVHTADLDGDGDIDVLSASAVSFMDGKIVWYENLGEALFDSGQIISESAHGNLVCTADLDGDGDMDVIYNPPFGLGDLVWYENFGEGVFGDEPAGLIGAHAVGYWSVQATDIDNDGDLDVVSYYSTVSGAGVAWYENLGEGLFGDAQIIFEDGSSEYQDGYSTSGFFIADLNGDGDMDILVTYNNSWYWSGTTQYTTWFSWYENLGAGLFGNGQVIWSSSFFDDDFDEEYSLISDVFCADLDGDGDMDVLCAFSGSNKIAWYENLGEGLFGDQQIISTQATGVNSILAADLDNDGDMDVLYASNTDDKLAWYENIGGGLFGDKEIISTQVDKPLDIHVSDLDGDGDLDVLSASYSDNKIAWYENLNGDGCTDPTACNYDPEAWIENNSCCYTCGCTVPGAVNYNPLACYDDGSCQFAVVGTVFFDENENGIMDGDDFGLPLQDVELLPSGLILTTNDNGNFLADASNSNEFNFTLTENSLFPFFTTPQSLTFDATQENWNQDTLYFGVSDDFPTFDLEANLYSVLAGFPCNDDRVYYLCFRNTGNNTVDVQVDFQYDELFQDITESSLIDSLGENVAYLSFSDVAPMELVCPQVELLSPTVAFIGEYLNTYMEVTAFYDGEEVAFGTDSLSEELLCAYDPNDKQVFPEGYTDEHYIANDTTLEYLIRFQNTGNAPATDVIIRDTLDQNLDLSTFQLLVHSHSVFTTLNPTTREVEFYFENIMLADSVNNEPESHGLVSFTIRPEADLPLLTELNNTAAIYFDNNPPIITNTTWSTIYDCSLFEVSLFTDGGALLAASTGDAYQWYLNGEPIDAATEQEYLATEDGSYSVQIDNDFPCSVLSGSIFVAVTGIQDWGANQIHLFPNPMTTTAVMDVGEITGPIHLEIYDMLGKLERSEWLSAASGRLTLERRHLAKGIYILRLSAEQETYELKFVVD